MNGRNLKFYLLLLPILTFPHSIWAHPGHIQSVEGHSHWLSIAILSVVMCLVIRYLMKKILFRFRCRDTKNHLPLNKITEIR